MRLPTSTIHSMFSLSTPQEVGVLPSVGYPLSFLNHWALDSPADVSLLHTLNNFHSKLYCPKGHHRKVETVVLAPSVYPVYFFLGNQEPSSANLLLFIFLPVYPMAFACFPKHLGSWLSSSSVEPLLDALVEVSPTWSQHQHRPMS